MFEVLYIIIESTNHSSRVRQLVDVRVDRVENRSKSMNEIESILAHIIRHDQDQSHDDDATNMRA